jgi:hypothetical protein
VDYDLAEIGPEIGVVHRGKVKHWCHREQIRMAWRVELGMGYIHNVPANLQILLPANM